jgi:isoquinoline 1-oxidoreductase beta subunit
MSGPTRRLVLFGGLALGAAGSVGGLGVGWAFLSEAAMDARARGLAGRPDAPLLAGWLRIAPDNTVTVIVPHVEMGQGVHTSLPMMLAEDLDADWSLVRVEQAPADVAFANGALARGFTRDGRTIPDAVSGLADRVFREVAFRKHIQITGGSTSVRCTGVDGMRRVGAAAKGMLIAAAAARWGVSEAHIVARASRLTHEPTGRSATYGDLATEAARFTPSPTAPLKQNAVFTIIGTDRQRLDIPAKVDGSARYGLDVRLPAMLYGAIAAAPVFGAKLLGVDRAPARGMRGVVKVVTLDDAVVVLADNTWRARQALASLKPVWSDAGKANLSSAAILAAMKDALAGRDLAKDFAHGDAERALTNAARRVEAVYRVPYLAHAQLEPIACTAWLREGVLDIHGGFQDPLTARVDASRLAGLPLDAVSVHPTAIGGSFGRRLPVTTDYLARAIAVAKTVAAPVQLAWSREEDMTQGFYRQAAVALMRGGLDTDGKVVAWSHRFSEKHDPADATWIDYDIPDRQAFYASGHNPIPWGNWRGVDHSVHGFAIECFMDELAREAGQDPLAFRLAHLSGAPRHAAVLERAAALADWGKPPPAERARGIALRQAFGTIVAQIAEVSVDASGGLRVHRLISVCDPGTVVHPANLAAQIKGAAIFGLTAALYGAITIEGGRVVETNFTDYDMVRMADAPAQVVRFIETPGVPLGGGGEPGTVPVAAAVANAAFALTGHRVRDLPLGRFNFKTGVKST